MPVRSIRTVYTRLYLVVYLLSFHILLILRFDLRFLPRERHQKVRLALTSHHLPERLK